MDDLIMMAEKQKIGFIGIGLMGWGMAKNVVEKGFPLSATVHRKREAIEDLIKRGASETGSVEELAKTCDVIVLCVTGTPQVEENMAKILPNMKAGLIVIDTSTAEPESTKKLAIQMAEKGGTFVDAPLSRTPSHAWDGELTTFVSCSNEMLAEVTPILETWASVIIHVNEHAGSAHGLKLVNNLVSLGYVSLWSECYATCAKLGIDPKIFRELINNTGMTCGNFENFSKYVCDGDANAHKFTLANGFKDLTYYGNMASAMNLAQPMSEPARGVLSKAIEAGMGDQFITELVDLLLKENENA